jgi:hypothetical protein
MFFSTSAMWPAIFGRRGGSRRSPPRLSYNRQTSSSACGIRASLPHVTQECTRPPLCMHSCATAWIDFTQQEVSRLWALACCLPEIERQFDPIIFSYQHGACKPNPVLYGAVAHSLGTAANRLLLIDDALQNVQGAQAAGWQAISFTHPDVLREALSRFGGA